MEESNYYEDKKNREFLDNTPEKNKKGEAKPEKKEKEETEKEKLTRTAKEVGTDFAVGVLGGGLGAAVCGRYSLLTGLLVSGWGHYTKNRYIARLGLGLMASSSMTAAQGVKQDPTATMVDNMKERVKAFGQELKRKLFLDKIGAVKKQEKQELSGIEKKSEVPGPAHFKEKSQPEAEYIKPENSIDATSSVNGKEEIDGIEKDLYKDYGEDFKDVKGKLF